MSKWTQIIDADVAWACGKLGGTAAVNDVVELIASEKGRAYAPQEVQSSIQRLQNQQSEG